MSLPPRTPDLHPVLVLHAPSEEAAARGAFAGLRMPVTFIPLTEEALHTLDAQAFRTARIAVCELASPEQKGLVAAFLLFHRFAQHGDDDHLILGKMPCLQAIVAPTATEARLVAHREFQFEILNLRSMEGARFCVDAWLDKHYPLPKAPATAVPAPGIRSPHPMGEMLLPSARVVSERVLAPSPRKTDESVPTPTPAPITLRAYRDAHWAHQEAVKRPLLARYFGGHVEANLLLILADTIRDHRDTYTATLGQLAEMANATYWARLPADAQAFVLADLGHRMMLLGLKEGLNADLDRTTGTVTFSGLGRKQV